LTKVLLVCTVVACAVAGRTAELAVTLLGGTSLNEGRLTDWSIKVNRGTPEISVCGDTETGPCLRLLSVKASFSLEREADIDPARTPYLAWRWKVAQLPPGGDFRRASTDDQAAQVLVAFSDHRVLTYIWDTTAPKGSARNASSIPFVHIFAVVCESGAADANRWIQENQNVAADYERAFGRPAPRVKGLRLQINSQHTGSVAESYFGEVAFRSTPE
jgi:hypothetical protein